MRVATALLVWLLCVGLAVGIAASIAARRSASDGSPKNVGSPHPQFKTLATSLKPKGLQSSQALPVGSYYGSTTKSVFVARYTLRLTVNVLTVDYSTNVVTAEILVDLNNSKTKLKAQKVSLAVSRKANKDGSHNADASGKDWSSDILKFFSDVAIKWYPITDTLIITGRIKKMMWQPSVTFMLTK